MKIEIINQTGNPDAGAFEDLLKVRIYNCLKVLSTTHQINDDAEVIGHLVSLDRAILECKSLSPELEELLSHCIPALLKQKIPILKRDS